MGHSDADRTSTSLHGAGQLAHVAQIARQVGYAGYLGADMLVWLGTIRFLRYDKEYASSPSRSPGSADAL